MVRFLTLALLTLKFGPDVVHLVRNVFQKHLYVVLLFVAAGAVGWMMQRRAAKQNRQIQAQAARQGK
jgi:hypothetical protein